MKRFVALMMCAVSLLSTAQLTCDCPDGQVEIVVEFNRSLCGGNNYCDTNPYASSWQIVNQNGTVLADGTGYDSQNSYCIPHTDELTVYGFDPDGSSWNGGSLKLKTKLGVSFLSFTPSGSYEAVQTVPMIDGYITPLSGTCVYEIRDHFDNTVWHSGYTGNCIERECILPAGQFELFTYANTSMSIRVEKISGFPFNQGVIFEGSFNNPSPGYCNECARSGMLPTCECGVANLDSDLICDNVDSCIGVIDECGLCNGPGIPDGNCDCEGSVDDATGVCGGSCQEDSDQDGICDDIDDCIGIIDECGICNGNGIPQGECDCFGSTFDALGDCGGSCVEDLDNDGLCDDADPCIGSYDECGICNGPGSILDCGCVGIPLGDCDCNGSQLDVLGVCGGSCVEDLDNDGLCDDADPCIGSYDACGICNGPGEIYECGCEEIPEGTCDCQGGISAECLGCTFPFATNYDPYSLLNDGSCDYDLQELIDAGWCVEELAASISDSDLLVGLEIGEAGPDGRAKIVRVDIDNDFIYAAYPVSLGYYKWGCKLTDVSATDWVFGSGESNTLLLVTQTCMVNDDETTAAQAAYGFDGLGFNDWFLPSMLEAQEMCQALSLPWNPSGTGHNESWTSTQCPPSSMSSGCSYGEGELYNAMVGELNGGCGNQYRQKDNHYPVFVMRSQPLSQPWGPNSSCANSGNTCLDSGACNYLEVSDCLYPTVNLNCDGTCITDADNDGICDQEDPCVGLYDACGVCNGNGIPQGECDCFGTQLDAIGVCGGSCLDDQDEDGICDSEDDCIGQYDVCGVCNGAGVPEGYCDCAGNTIDEIGVCGGLCEADADNDGLCDSEDDCIILLDTNQPAIQHLSEGQCIASLLDAGYETSDLLGLSFGGGVIAYVLEEDMVVGEVEYYRGDALVASEDSYTASSWGPCNMTTTWENNGFGGGRYNTELLISLGCDNALPITVANYSAGGYDDWHLPSLNELKMIEDLGAMSGHCGWYFWSSTSPAGDPNSVYVEPFGNNACNNQIGDGTSTTNKFASGYSWDWIPIRYLTGCGQYGCIDEAACNYSCQAVYSDDSCVFDCGPGCTDANACNYDENATSDDGSCDYCSCTIRPQVCINEWTATAILNDKGELSLTTQGFTPNEAFAFPDEDLKFSQIALGDNNNGSVLAGIDQDGEIHFYGGTARLPVESYFQSVGSNQTWTEIAASQGDAYAGITSLGQAVIMHGGNPQTPPLPNELVWSVRHIDVSDEEIALSLDDGSVWKWNYNDNSLVPHLNTTDEIIKVDLTSRYASNSEVGVLTATGEILGLTGSLVPPPGIFFIDFECDNGNLCVGRTTENLIYSWGTQPLEEPISSAVDIDLGNYKAVIDLEGNISYYPSSIGELQELPNFASTSTYLGCLSCDDVDSDSICDDEDPCVGIEDECGVCNGPGATYQCGCDPIEVGACDCLGNTLDDCGVCGGDNTTCLGDAECLDDDDSVEALGGCINAIALLGCDALWFGSPLSEICTFACDACPCDSDINNNGICDDAEVLGCTYTLADNYNAGATLDDGSCLFTCYAETDLQDAYNSGAESVECPEETNNDCATDLDNDGEVATSDLLLFLSTFGDSCD